MKIKTGLFYFALLLTLPAYAGHVVVDENAVGGAFNLTFYIEPTLYTGATYCLTFTKTGFLAGYAQSGTFADNAGDIQGTWYQSGDEILLSTIFSNAEEAAPMTGRLLSGASKFGGRFFLFSTGDPGVTILDGGTFLAVKTTSCPTGDAIRTPRKGGTAVTAGSAD